MQARFKYHKLIFKIPGGTSRGILKTKDSWFLILENNGKIGIGECSVIYGLNPESKSLVEKKMTELCHRLNSDDLITPDFFDGCPSILFAYEMAMLDLKSSSDMDLFNSPLCLGESIAINGLVWMGEKQFMFDQIKAKIQQGFKCIKIKIAAIDFEDELSLLKYIRSEFTEKDIQIRVDANGGFEIDEAFEKLKILSAFDLHSIEQPIVTNHYNEMSDLCRLSPLPIALDEELIGVDVEDNGGRLLNEIAPHYIILKPSLLGGIAKSKLWINEAEKLNIGWWVTSALESNIGLSAIAQWTSTLNNNMYQGLGTGQLFTNNIPSPLFIENGSLHYHGEWDLTSVLN